MAIEQLKGGQYDLEVEFEIYLILIKCEKPILDLVIGKALMFGTAWVCKSTLLFFF